MEKSFDLFELTEALKIARHYIMFVRDSILLGIENERLKPLNGVIAYEFNLGDHDKETKLEFFKNFEKHNEVLIQYSCAKFNDLDFHSAGLFVNDIYNIMKSNLKVLEEKDGKFHIDIEENFLIDAGKMLEAIDRENQRVFSLMVNILGDAIEVVPAPLSKSSRKSKKQVV